MRVAARASLAQQLLLERFSPAAVLANADFEAIYSSGPTENYLRIPRGAPTEDLLAQVRDGLRSRLHNALRQATASGATVVVQDARVRRNKVFHPVRLTVVPTRCEGEPAMLFLIVFEDLAPPVAQTYLGNESLLVRQLEELRATKDDLQNSIKCLETANEELQSSNEELTTVNQELQVKVVELESSQIATICIDRDFCIRWFSPSMSDVGDIIAGDAGRPITDFSSAGLGENLVEDAKNVLATRVTRQRELHCQEDRWYLRRMAPYRSDGGQIGGVVITYTDITEAKQATEAIIDAQRTMAASLEDRVRARTAQLRALTAELALAEERERRVLARDLHDDLGQLLAVAKIKLTSLEESERRGMLKSALTEIETLIDQVNRSVRSLMQQLHPPALQALNFVDALEWLGEEMDRLYDLVVHVDKDGDLPVLEEPARTTIFRAVRELLINVAKHANTNIAQINVHRDAEERLLISVTDHGRGFEYAKTATSSTLDSGYGLSSVRERIEFLGGEMIVDSTPGFGTTVTIAYPAKQQHSQGEPR